MDDGSDRGEGVDWNDGGSRDAGVIRDEGGGRVVGVGNDESSDSVINTFVTTIVTKVVLETSAVIEKRLSWRRWWSQRCKWSLNDVVSVHIGDNSG